MTGAAVNYYNEFDPDAAQWLRNLIAAGLIPAGDVDERSIEDVRPNDLRGYTQCHFFAGIGGWPLALDLAGWPRDRPVWTGSCPCQPFSSAGKGDGFADERHLWPAWFHLIRECRPNVVFGEQVASAIRHGWLDLVSAGLEAEGYAVGGAVLGAHSVGAPHIRQRLYWVADANQLTGRQGRQVNGGRDSRGYAEARARSCGSGVHILADATSQRLGEAWGCGERPAQRNGCGSDSGCAVGDASDTGSQGHGRPFNVNDAEGRQDARRHGATSGFWAGEWRTGADGKARLIEPSIEPLAHGVSARVVRLRGYGNAIVPQTAAAFIGSFIEVKRVQGQRELLLSRLKGRTGTRGIADLDTFG